MNWEKYMIRPSSVTVLIYLSTYLISVYFITSLRIYNERTNIHQHKKYLLES